MDTVIFKNSIAVECVVLYVVTNQDHVIILKNKTNKKNDDKNSEDSDRNTEEKWTNKFQIQPVVEVYKSALTNSKLAI